MSDLKKFLNLFFAKFVSIAPARLIRLLLFCLGGRKNENRNSWDILSRLEHRIWIEVRNWPESKIIHLGNLIKVFKLVSVEDIPEAKLVKRVGGGKATNNLPAVLNICSGGKIDYDFEDEFLYEIANASFTLESDFIRLSELVVCEKLLRKDATILIPEDFDFVHFEESKVILTAPKHKLYVNNAFFMTGVLSGFWSHFLISFYPRLAYLDSVGENISIVIPFQLDNNIRELISKHVNHLKNVSLLEVSHGVEICCDRLIYAKTNSYILCHSSHVGPHGVQISFQTGEYLLTQFKSEVQDFSESSPRKIFIGRNGHRNIENYYEVLSYFKTLGFEEVFPHKLSLEEKRHVFSRATHIVGPLSSGFTNLVYCSKKIRLLVFTNYARCYDTYIATLANLWEDEIMFCSGKDVDAGINSNYRIDLREVEQYVKQKFIK